MGEDTGDQEEEGGRETAEWELEKKEQGVIGKKGLGLIFSPLDLSRP